MVNSLGHLFVAKQPDLEMNMDSAPRVPTGKDRSEVDTSIRVGQLAPAQERPVKGSLCWFVRINPICIAVPDVYLSTLDRRAVTLSVDDANSQREGNSFLGRATCASARMSERSRRSSTKYGPSPVLGVRMQFVPLTTFMIAPPHHLRFSCSSIDEPSASRPVEAETLKRLMTKSNHPHQVFSAHDANQFVPFVHNRQARDVVLIH